MCGKSVIWDNTTEELLTSFSDVAEKVIYDMPPDPTSIEDMIHAALFSRQMRKALLHSSKLDRWLSAHLADIMEALSLIEPGIDDEYVYMAVL